MPRTTLTAVVVASLAHAGCYRTVRLPPPPMPQQIAPPVASDGEPAPGLSRVVLDSADGPALVEQVSGGSVAGRAGATRFGASVELATRLCTTPCVVDMPPGPYELRFTLLSDADRTSEGFVNIDQQPTVYRHAVGQRQNNAWKGFVGWPVLVLGVVLDLAVLSQLGQSSDPMDEFDTGPDRGAVLGTGVIGVGLTVLGGWLVYGSTVVEQPGSGTQWHP